MTKPRPLTMNEILFLSKLNKFLQEYFNTDEPMCCIAGGYMHADRMARDVDLFVYEPSIVNSPETFYYTLLGYLNKLGKPYGKQIFKQSSKQSAEGKSYVFQFDISFDGLFGSGEIPVQVIVFDRPIKEIIVTRFPLSIQQQAYIPTNVIGVVEYYESELCKALAGTNVCWLINKDRSNTERYVDKYKGYYPEMEFV